jgi:glucan phosphoethanolaminetransferase (alkaline phosphatase superfamily)
LVAPAFALAALATPGLIALLTESAPQHMLLGVGLTAGLTSSLLVLYRWPSTRLALHLVLLSVPLELFYRLVYRGAVSPGILLSAAETNVRETSEMLAGHALATAFLLPVAALALYGFVFAWRADNPFSLRHCIRVCAVSALLVLASWAAGWQRSAVFELADQLKQTFPFDIAHSFRVVVMGFIDTHNQAAARAAFAFPGVRMVDAASRRDAPEIYVVVVGETSRRANWSLFGYPRATTPRLDAIRDDLVIVEHMTANATLTVLSVPLALTRATPATWEIARSERSIISLLRQAGFSVLWISNQEHFGRRANPVSAIALEASSVSFPEDTHAGIRQDYTRDGVGPGGFDSNLLDRLQVALAQVPTNGKIVVFLHMIGSHFAYHDRYPKNFEAFRGTVNAPRALPAPQLRLLNEYDNSVYFTDYVVRSAIDQLAARGGMAALLYFSDHGERLFDDGLTEHDLGHGFPTVSRQEIEIPYFLWLSNGYQAAHPALVARLRANARSPAELDSLFETIVDLAGIEYDRRDKARSLLSEAFRAPQALEVLNTEEQPLFLTLGDVGDAEQH